MEQISKKPTHSMKARKRASLIICYTLLIVISIVWLVPFFCLLVQSFRTSPRGITNRVFQPGAQWGIENYVDLFTQTNFPKWYLNTFIIALFNSVLTTFMILTMAYTLSRLRFKGRKFLMKLMLVLGMFPGFLTMIILYNVLKDLNMTQENAVWGLILVSFASSGMGYYVSKGFFDTIPKSLDEAARIDGATRAQVLTKIILPLSKPIVIYTVLTAFMAPWGDFIFAKQIAFGEQAGYNVAVGLFSFLEKDTLKDHYTMFCAAGVVVAIPVTVLFMCLQKYYVEGVTGGAVKG